MSEKTDDLKIEIQKAVAMLNECEAAMRLGESNLAHDLIRQTIVRFERLLHEAETVPQT
ncbi:MULTISPECIES: hypothetical protein [unclassified Mesorhizobium]|jgi:hypothetical protein|uniref:hypothetical protein n=1 Tax=unclassified Mesorhizobium TaxID=325217 RepID=UPI0012DD43D5|nr:MULTISPECIES: hypothetical protein [unclassified Mesorhizobium]WJI70588.1 hypothetical protein NLY36_07260 [Mesorhizobium sp. C399B]WJI81978.1 hypothetical protein NLY34_04250 [Mesorhizobium sp. C374B]WJI88497.1 hypothetical protein NLY42_06660 [Mesorhizobium sp. C372A]